MHKVIQNDLSEKVFICRRVKKKYSRCTVEREKQWVGRDEFDMYFSFLIFPSPHAPVTHEDRY